MPSPLEALIAAAEACEVAATALERADEVIKEAKERTVATKSAADQAIVAAITATQRRMDVGRTRPQRTRMANVSEEAWEAEGYRERAEDCRSLAKMFEQ